MKKRSLALVVSLAMSACASSRTAPASPVELKHFSLDSMEGVRATTGVSFDRQISSDGKGSLRIDASQPLTVPLFEVTDLSIENAALIYQASLQSQNLDGKAYLEMWLRFPGKGEFFSRGLDRPITGTMSWMTSTIPFFLQAGQKPDLIRLNLVVAGEGGGGVGSVRALREAPVPPRVW